MNSKGTTRGPYTQSSPQGNMLCLQAVDDALACVTVHRAYDVHAVLAVIDGLLKLQVGCCCCCNA
jgi:hypothetical protein